MFYVYTDVEENCLYILIYNTNRENNMWNSVDSTPFGNDDDWMIWKMLMMMATLMKNSTTYL